MSQKLDEFAHGFREDGLSILYEAKTDHLVDLSFKEIKNLGSFEFSEPEEYLDQLYRNKKIMS